MLVRTSMSVACRLKAPPAAPWCSIAYSPDTWCTNLQMVQNSLYVFMILEGIRGYVLGQQDILETFEIKWTYQKRDCGSRTNNHNFRIISLVSTISNENSSALCTHIYPGYMIYCMSKKSRPILYRYILSSRQNRLNYWWGLCLQPKYI